MRPGYLNLGPGPKLGPGTQMWVQDPVTPAPEQLPTQLFPSSSATGPSPGADPRPVKGLPLTGVTTRCPSRGSRSPPPAYPLAS